MALPRPFAEQVTLPAFFLVDDCPDGTAVLVETTEQLDRVPKETAFEQLGDEWKRANGFPDGMVFYGEVGREW